MQYLNGLAQLSRTVSIRPVATNHARFLDKNDFIVHEARVCIQQGVTLEDKKRIKSFSHEQFFCSSNQMKKKFKGLKVAVLNSVKVSTQCNFDFENRGNLLPAFPIESDATEAELLKRQSTDGLNLRLKNDAGYKDGFDTERLELYKLRMEKELKS